jgi:hypothetical protein
VAEILAWADAQRERTGAWPNADSGPIPESPRDKWSNIDAALRKGLRGLEGGSSLPRLLALQRDHRNRKALPPLTEGQILSWADAHRVRTGRWPTGDDGSIPEAPGETWMAVAMALAKGLRSLPGGSSLARLLAAERGHRHKRDLPAFSEKLILVWADAFHARTGTWPNGASGPIEDAPGETWSVVDRALRNGRRGLPGGSSLARLFAFHRGVRNRMDAPPLTLDEILAWADAHYARSGVWPSMAAGPIPEASGETWSAVDAALREGRRELPVVTTLAKLLTEQRQRPWKAPGPRRPRLSVEETLAWADAYRERTGRWPDRESGAIPEAPGETWCAVSVALSHGERGMPRGSSLPRLLAEHRGRRFRDTARPLTEGQILTWADEHHDRTGEWPSESSGPIPGATGETWHAVQGALRSGHRGLPGGSSLARLLAEHRGRRTRLTVPPLSIEQILSWADAHQARTGVWPRLNAGPIPEAPGETWAAVDAALHDGGRGLPGGSSLPRLLAEHRGRRNVAALPPLTPASILQWADAHHARHGRWPAVRSGPVEAAAGETWAGVDAALRSGVRGLPGGSSLTRLLAEQRQMRNPCALPDLAKEQILAWARVHHERTGRWPTCDSGAIDGAPGETWAAVDAALRSGGRGLTGGSSVSRLLRGIAAAPHAASPPDPPGAPPPSPQPDAPPKRLSPHLEAMRPKSLASRDGRPDPDANAAGERH